MTWRNRFRLLAGLAAVLVLVAGLTIVFNQRQARVASISASIEAERYPVGIDYGGTVIDRFVDAGTRVHAGQDLFSLQSSSLQADLAEGLVKPDTVAYSVAASGIITLKASVDGTVTDLSTERGSFVQAGQVLAMIDRAGSLFVSADYALTPRDYARVEDGAAVDILLPNQRQVSGRIESIEVQTADGRAETTVRVASDQLVDGDNNGLVARGTPVTATIMLRDDGVLAGVGDGVSDFLRKIGL